MKRRNIYDGKTYAGSVFPYNQYMVTYPSKRKFSFGVNRTKEEAFKAATKLAQEVMMEFKLDEPPKIICREAWRYARGKADVKDFSYLAHGTSELAYEAAIKYQKEQSDKHKLTEDIPLTVVPDKLPEGETRGGLTRYTQYNVCKYINGKKHKKVVSANEPDAKEDIEKFAKQLTDDYKLPAIPKISTRSGWIFAYTRKQQGKVSRTVKYFSDKKHGGADEAKKAAQIYGDEWVKNNYQHHKIREIKRDVPIEIQKYVAGFLDGDGTVQAHMVKNAKGAAVHGSFAQACESRQPIIFDLILKHYEGSVYFEARPGPNKRNRWTLSISGAYAYSMFKDLVHHSVLKYGQIQLALQLLERKCDDRKAVCEQIKNMHALESYKQVKIDKNRINPSWTAGFFDAEGCVCVTKHGMRVRVMFAQTSSPELLESLRVYFKDQLNIHARITSDIRELEIYRIGDILPILHFLEPICIGKKPQLQKAIEFQNLRNTLTAGFTTHPTLIELAAEIKRLKKV